jgi:oxygen-independent coproporphyrinogen-3 oxidase
MHDPYKALYLHVPFCKRRCLYCDFATRVAPLGSPEMREYTERMILDIRRAGREGDLADIETVYIGGGTPTYIGHAALTEMLYTLSLSMHLTPEVECSIEANPDSLTESMVKDIWALGVNRLSIGVQSFDDRMLRTLGRVHDADAARRAVDAARKRFENVSIDLMCGIPGQTVDMLQRSIHEAIELGATHISIYPLAIEEGTPFDRMIAAGELPDIDDDDEAAFMRAAAEMLETAGMPRYEVASYAKPGFECRHNEAYWTGVPYLGLGPSAATMTQYRGHRVRTRDGEVLDDLDPVETCAEDALLKMRMGKGMSDDEVACSTVLLPDLPATLRSLVRQGMLEHEGGRWRPTEHGWLCGNNLYGAIYDLAP